MFKIPSVYGDLKTHDDQLARYVCKHESDDPDLVTKNKQTSVSKQDVNREVTQERRISYHGKWSKLFYYSLFV